MKFLGAIFISMLFLVSSISQNALAEEADRALYDYLNGKKFPRSRVGRFLWKHDMECWNSPSNNGENTKNNIKIINIIIGNKYLKAFLPATIGIAVNKPSHAFLEKVKNAAIPVEIRKPKVIVFLKKFFPLSRNNAIQKGQTKLSQDAA